MEFKYRRIALSDVDSDDAAFRISTPGDADVLAPSIQLLGVINPPILIANGKGFNIVAGFTRVDACRRIGTTKIQSRLIPPDAGAERCAMVSIVDNAMQRELNLIEQANAIRLLARFKTDEAQLVQSAQNCGLSVNQDMVRKLLAVGRMSSTLQQAILDGAIALPIALQLARMEDGRQVGAMVQLLLELRAGLNRQREILEWVLAITRRDTISVVDFLTRKDLHRLRTEPGKDRQVKSQMIRQLIRKIRYPTITRHEKRYARTVQSLKLKKGTQLLPPAHFEGRTYGLKFDFQSHNDLVHVQKELKRLIDSQAIRDLWADFT